MTETSPPDRQGTMEDELSPIPEDAGRPFVGKAPELLFGPGPVQTFMGIGRELGPIFRVRTMAGSPLIAWGADLVAELSDESRFDKKVHASLRELRALAGDGLFTARTTEPNWQLAHDILLPAFGMEAMRSYYPMMVEIAEQLVDSWGRGNAEDEIDVAGDMTRLTLDTIGLAGFDYRFNSFFQAEMHPFVDSMVRAMAESLERVQRHPLQDRLMIGRHRRFDADIKHLNGVVDAVIAGRRAAEEAKSAEQREADGAPKDLLGLMLHGSDRDGNQLDDVNIRYQIITFLIAGHETTSGLLSFAIHFLTKHPAVLARARVEIDGVLGADPHAIPAFEDIGKLTYIRQVLDETLRLWPTAPAFALTPYEDEVIGGKYAIRQGQAVLVLTPMLHRDPAVWGDNPELFDPERFSAEAQQGRPPHAYKPFGNGQRACIGRQFALQEAVLALALVLHRFDLIDHTNYGLRVKETLTLKPDRFRIRVRARTPERQIPDRRTTDGEPAAGPAAYDESDLATVSNEPEWADVGIDHDTPLLILYGSNLGTAESLARRVGDDGESRGFRVEVAPLDDRIEDLPTEGAVVVLCASYNGLPPDNAERFHEWIGGLSTGALSEVTYAVFGVGNRDWAATFQQVPRQLDERFAAAGATAMLGRGEADASGDFFGDFERWYAKLWPALSETLELGLGSVPGLEADVAPRYVVEVVAADRPDPLIVAHGAVSMTIVANRELVDVSSPIGRSKRLVRVALPEGATYETGDHLGVLGENRSEMTQRVADRFGLDPDDVVVIHPTQPGRGHLPIEQPVSVNELLSRYVELQDPATTHQLKQVAKYTESPPDKEALLSLAADDEDARAAYRSEILDPRVTLLHVIERYTACELPFGLFLELLPAMRPRLYSISSSPAVAPALADLTVSVVDEPAWSGQGRHLGVASNHLAGTVPGGEIDAFVQAVRTPFRPPTDSRQPYVMIAAGSGLAPFRGFLQDREAAAAAGHALGAAFLFFGCRHPEVDYLYRDELEAWERQGLVRLFPAFSRIEGDGPEAGYVQDRIRAEAQTLAPLLANRPQLYLCGDGKVMAPAVRDAIVSIHRDATDMSAEAAEAWCRELEATDRFLTDVWGG